jgi:hypothetical protein
MESKKLNRVQEYFNTIFSHDLSDKDFKELQQVVSGWLASKIRETTPSDLKKHSNSNGRERTQ